MSIFHRAKQNQSWQHGGILWDEMPANHSTAQTKEETPLKIKTIKHLAWHVQMIWDFKERKKRNQLYRNSNRQMAGSHPRLPTEDIYWDTERWIAKRNCLALLLPKKEDRSSLFPGALPSLTCADDGMAHHTHTVHGHCPGSLHFQAKIRRQAGSNLQPQNTLVSPHRGHCVAPPVSYGEPMFVLPNEVTQSGFRKNKFSCSLPLPQSWQKKGLGKVLYRF